MTTARHKEVPSAELPANADEPTQNHAAPTGGVSPGTLALFALGVVLLITAAASIGHLNDWMQRWGTVPVFLVFFLIMSLAGRWFWAGTDAILAAIRGNK